MVAIVAACFIFAFTGTAYAATPTNCTISGCGFGGKCIDNVAGTASTCVCYQGFEISLQTFECIDINECNYTSAALCRNGYCYNMYGDYKCNCYPGFIPHFPDGKTCVRTCTVTTNATVIQDSYPISLTERHVFEDESPSSTTTTTITTTTSSVASQPGYGLFS